MSSLSNSKSRDENSAAQDRWPDGSADECPKCGFLHAYDRSCEDRTPSAATTRVTIGPSPFMAWPTTSTRSGQSQTLHWRAES